MDFPRHELQSEETDTILNTIDKLRQLGVGGILDLPQIIVCGDQSSGKSSVLNAVSTLQFPTKDGLCTRFATEVIMRPGNPEHIVVSIVPGADRSHDEKSALAAFRRSDVSMDEIESIIEKATSAMGIDPQDPHARRFSDDVLKFEVTGPSQPSLTLVDLPGLFRAPSVYQTKEDITSVRDLVLRYMNNKRSVILAVVSAKSDFVLQSVTEISGAVDPRGLRTLGIVTKPDKLDVGSDSENMFVELVENRLKYLHRGWHVLVNRDHSTKSYSQDQRDDFEKTFLSGGVWAKISHNHKGVFSLRSRLSSALREHILEGLPDLISEADEEVARCSDILARLGTSRATADDRQRYLMQAAQVFSVIMRSSVNGSYDDKFFTTGDPDVYQRKHLRAVVQDALIQYSRDMQERGHAKHIVDDGSEEEKEGHPQKITQTEFEDSVMELMKYSRGRELMVTHNPMIVRDLFQKQSEPWVKLTTKYRSRLIEAAKVSIDLVLLHATDENTRAHLEKHVIKPSLERLVVSLDTMIDRLLKPRNESHPITYNRSLAENIAKAKQGRAEKFFAEKYERAINQGGQVVSKDTLKWLFEEQVVIQPMDLPRFAASEAIIEMRAYYKIARETLVDNFSTLAIEDCLISQMPNLFSPEVVTALDEDTVYEIAAETESAAWERVQTETRLELCRSALEDLRMIESMRAPALRMYDVKVPSPTSESEIINGQMPTDEHTEVSLSKLDLGLSEREDEQSLVDDFVEDSSINPKPRRKQKKAIVSDGDWVRFRSGQS
ncbi:Hypothetical protein R9X50_00631300 [Acrodontium crateriforme]|uniref:Dynamin family protein n=1 Tax=Acrodontium crateriforme TaxID=150365 RepID=A0AAQ3RDJ9_9PEZI|nr:Hypothetical protein R9X50_00631300 [Acrodontium crateriforme]